MKHYESMEILSNFQNVKTPAQMQSPLLKPFWLRFWLNPHILSRDDFVAFDS